MYSIILIIKDSIDDLNIFSLLIIDSNSLDKNVINNIIQRNLLLFNRNDYEFASNPQNTITFY